MVILIKKGKMMDLLDELKAMGFEEQEINLAQAEMTMISKMMLKDYSEYSKRVCEAYEARPVLESEVIPSYKALAEHTEKMFKQLLSRFDIQFQDEDAYKSFKELKREVEKTGLLKVYKGGSSHPVFTEEENWKLRAVHDLLGHLAGSGHSFSLKGEYAAYNQHLKILPPKAWPAMFTEVVGQVSCYYVNKDYPTQKACMLYGFDYKNIGNIDEEEYLKNFEGEDMKKEIQEELISAGFTKSEINMAVAQMELTPSQLEVLEEVNMKGCLERFLMGKDEIKDANHLVKIGFLSKGTADIKQSSRQYCITDEGEEYLKNL